MFSQICWKIIKATFEKMIGFGEDMDWVLVSRRSISSADVTFSQDRK